MLGKLVHKTLDDFIILQSLGRGGFGKVVLGKRHSSDSVFALKILDCSKFPEAERAARLQTLARETGVLQTLNHPNIIRFFGYRTKGEYRNGAKVKQVSYAILEFCSRGSLFEIIINCGGLSENPARFYFKQLLSALVYLRSKKISHRDIKPENILLGHDFGLKVADFGFATRSVDGSENSTFVGTELYMAPEFFVKPLRYSPAKVDAFACGVVLFCMYVGLLPFKKSTPECQMFQALASNSEKYWSFFENRIQRRISPALRTLLLDLLNPNPEERISLEAAQQSEWLQFPVDEQAAILEISTKLEINTQPISFASSNYFRESEGVTPSKATTTTTRNDDVPVPKPAQTHTQDPFSVSPVTARGAIQPPSFNQRSKAIPPVPPTARVEPLLILPDESEDRTLAEEFKQPPPAPIKREKISVPKPRSVYSYIQSKLAFPSKKSKRQETIEEEFLSLEVKPLGPTPEFQGFCLSVRHSDIPKLLDLVIARLVFDGVPLSARYNRKGAFSIRSEGVEAKVVVNSKSPADPSTIRLVQKQGGFLDFLDLQKKFNSAVRDLCRDSQKP